MKESLKESLKGSPQGSSRRSSVSLDRRQFVGLGAAAGVAAGAMAGVSAGMAPGAGVAAADASEASAEKAGWRTPAEPIDESQIAERRQTDVVVVGAGNSGVYAACAAAEAGASVILLEKNDVNGTRRSYIGAIGSAASAASGNAPDPMAVVRELARYSDYRAKQSLIKVWAERSGETMDWVAGTLADEGVEVRFQDDVNEDVHLAEYPTQHSLHMADGTALADPLGMLLAKFPQVEVVYGMPMRQLVREEGGRVTGVIACDVAGSGEADGTAGTERYVAFDAAKGVVLCTGGYNGDRDMLAELNPEVAQGIVQNVGWPYNTGDGIKAAVWAGAAKSDLPNAMVFDRGVVMPGGTAGEPYSDIAWGPGFVFGSQPFLAVNTRGERFVNESIPYDYKAHAAWRQPGGVWIEVWDSKWAEDVARFHTIGCSRIVDPGNGALGGIFPVEGHEMYIGSMIEAGACVTAGTVEGLAEAIGVPADALAATVARYNELFEAQSDDDFGKEAFRLSSVAEPPFYAITLGGQLLCTLDGLDVDEGMHVLDEDGEVIEGLFAAGNDSGGFFAGNYPELVVGSAVGRSVTFGRIAGQNAALGE